MNCIVCSATTSQTTFHDAAAGKSAAKPLSLGVCPLCPPPPPKHMHDVIEVSSQASSSTSSLGIRTTTTFDVIELTDDSDSEIVVNTLHNSNIKATTMIATTSKGSQEKNRKKRKLVLVDSDSHEDGEDGNADLGVLASAAPKNTRAGVDSLVSKTKKNAKTRAGTTRTASKLFLSSSRSPSPVAGASSLSKNGGGPSLEGNGPSTSGPSTSDNLGTADKGKGKAKAIVDDANSGDEDGQGLRQTNSPYLSRQPSPKPIHKEPSSKVTIDLDLPASSTPPSPPPQTIAEIAFPSSPPRHASPPTPPPPPPPLLETPEERMTRYTAQVLEIIPDVEPEHCATLVANHFPGAQDATVERVLHVLFEDASYPKAQKRGVDKGKRKAADEGEGGEGGRARKKARVSDAGGKAKGKGKAEEEGDAWLDVTRLFIGGRDYHDLALNRLQEDYPFIPKPYLRTVLASHKGFYAPAFFFLRRLDEDNDRDGDEDYFGMDVDLPYTPRKSPYKPPKGRGGKGKQKVMEDEEFQRERAWVVRRVDIEEGKAVDVGGSEEGDSSEEEEDNHESEGEDEENGIECGCCFSKFRFERMVQCPDAHLFCRSCLRSYASTLLGTHNPHVTCMSQSPCTHSFPASQLLTVLPRKTYALYERLLQAQEIAKANLEGLEECPFCEWKCVFDVGFEEEKLFRCDGCGGVSCRKCGKLDHLPKSCEEMEKDRKLDARHEVEEAMTKALMRNCPKCQKAFIKESGCNKMTCPNCQTLSCYICRKIISGYEHFNQGGRPGSSSRGKCILWDKDLEAMHTTEVKRAAEEAVQKVKALHRDVSDSDLKVDLPKTKPPQNNFNTNLGVIFAPNLPPYRPANPNPNPFMPIPQPRLPYQPQAALPVRGRPQNNPNPRHGGGGGGPPPNIPHAPNPYNAARQLRQARNVNPQPHPIPPQFQHNHHHHHHNGMVPPEPMRPYHEIVAQAMMGRYEPPGGGMEVGGKVLRARPGRAAAPAGPGGPEMGGAPPVYQQQVRAGPGLAVQGGNVAGNAAAVEGRWRRERYPIMGAPPQQQHGQGQAAQLALATRLQQQQQQRQQLEQQQQQLEQQWW